MLGVVHPDAGVLCTGAWLVEVAEEAAIAGGFALTEVAVLGKGPAAGRRHSAKILEGLSAAEVMNAVRGEDEILARVWRIVAGDFDAGAGERHAVLGGDDNVAGGIVTHDVVLAAVNGGVIRDAHILGLRRCYFIAELVDDAH